MLRGLSLLTVQHALTSSGHRAPRSWSCGLSSGERCDLDEDALTNRGWQAAQVPKPNHFWAGEVCSVASVMDVLWIAAIAIRILLEKSVPTARLISRISGALLAAAGVWLERSEWGRPRQPARSRSPAPRVLASSATRAGADTRCVSSR